MQYRKFGRMDWDVSALGFGCMRLPKNSDDPKDIDEPAATEMVRYAIDQGLNYIDTAYGYHGGQSEIVVGRMLQDGYREKVRLASKLPVWLAHKYEDFDRLLNEQLEKVGTDHFDVYLLHALNKPRWENVRDLKVLQWGEKALSDGRIGAFGFSFHDKYEVFDEIINAYDWHLCQIQYNYIDTEVQAGLKGLQQAAAKDMAVIIMEPLLGGKLADLPPAVDQIWSQSDSERTSVGWALDWLWDQPEVTTILSGMSAME